MARANNFLARNDKTSSGDLRDTKAFTKIRGSDTVMRLFRGPCVLAIVFTTAACAGRDPMPVATSQAQDINANCAQITAEIEANNIKVRELAEEQGAKTTQNVAAGVAGFFIPVLWFAMDFKGAASKDAAALQARQQYLTTLANERCHAPASGPPQRRPVR
jgi:hypothetical protein